MFTGGAVSRGAQDAAHLAGNLKEGHFFDTDEQVSEKFAAEDAARNQQNADTEELLSDPAKLASRKYEEWVDESLKKSPGELGVGFGETAADAYMLGRSFVGPKAVRAPGAALEEGTIVESKAGQGSVSKYDELGRASADLHADSTRAQRLQESGAVLAMDKPGVKIIDGSSAANLSFPEGGPQSTGYLRGTHYPTPEGNHFSWEVRTLEGQRLETHLTGDARTNVRTIAGPGDLKGLRASGKTMTVGLPNAQAAMTEQQRLAGAGNQGPLGLNGPTANSCATHGCDLMNAGGAPVPPNRSDYRPFIYRGFGLPAPQGGR
jgi:hypothetical protein